MAEIRPPRIEYTHKGIAKDEYAHCEGPRINRTIRVRPTLKDQKLLEILIHEMLHWFCWRRSEKWVEHTAKEMAEVIWQKGFRQSEE